MTNEKKLIGVKNEAVEKACKDFQFYLERYDLVANVTALQTRRNKVSLGGKDDNCRFCDVSKTDGDFKKEAHALPQLVGNFSLFSCYECDNCNGRFGKFEEDLSSFLHLKRIVGGIKGKTGIPSYKTFQKLSRIDSSLSNGMHIKEYKDDRIIGLNEETKTLTLKVTSHPYRPLGVYKALLKSAVTILPPEFLIDLPQAVEWLKYDDLDTGKIDDGTGYTCIESFTAGPRPINNVRALIFKRKEGIFDCPNMVFILAFGNHSYQIFMPCPEKDKELVGKNIILSPIPVFQFLSEERTKGSTTYNRLCLSSDKKESLPLIATMSYESSQELSEQENTIVK